MTIMIPRFNRSDYRALNPDIPPLPDTTYLEEHYQLVGKAQGRLVNRYQLVVTNEFGNELVLYLPYYYFLYINNLWSDTNKIYTYKGMTCMYFWLPPEQIIERREPRRWIPNAPWEKNNRDYVKSLTSHCGYHRLSSLIFSLSLMQYPFFLPLDY
jgi:hypothetical protein